MTDSSVTLELHKGRKVIPYLQDLAKLRILFYRNYPYLYEGTLEDEEKYLNMYANSDNALLVVAKKDQEVVGAVAGIALLETHDEHKKLWADLPMSSQNLFYLGEIVLLPEYQKSDLQEKLYQQIEQAVRGLNKYHSIVVCEIERNAETPKQLYSHSLSSEVNWETRAFVRQPDLSTYFSWKDVDDTEETDHLMLFWTKDL